MGNYGLGVATLSWLFLFHDISHAQVVTDGTTGAGKELAGPDFDIDADLGTQAGSNLFHSFEKFSIGTDESATFSGPGGIDNVIGRVTGGDISSIDGLLASTIPGASLWLFNPAGVVFGPNASLDVSGSFHVSTADELRTADGGRFSAVDPESSGFSVAAPESFGFLGANPAEITIAGSQLSIGDSETLSVVGGDVDIAGANLAVGAGNLNILAADGAADANVVTGELTGADDGAVTLRADAALSTTGDGGGTIRIEGGAFVVDEDTSILSTNTGTTDGDIGIDIDVTTADIGGGSLVSTQALAEGRGGDLDLRADDIQVTESAIIGSSSGAAGDGGDISIAADTVAFHDNGSTISLGQADGNGGDIGITAGDLTLLDGGVVTGTQGSGEGGDIVISAASLEVLADGPDERSQITTASFGLGDAGNIDIRGRQVRLDAGNQIVGAVIQTLPDGEGGRAGQIRIAVDSLALLRGGLVFGDSSSGSASASSIEVSANEIRIDGSGNQLTGINLFGNSQATATPGGIAIQAGDLDIRNGGSIDTSTSNANDAGNISITSDSLTLAGEGQRLKTKISSSSSLDATGNAGRITIVAETIELSDETSINSDTFSEGDGGSIDITATKSLRLQDSSAINTSSQPTATGDAGSISIDAVNLTTLDGGKIISATFGPGDAGSIDVIAELAVLDARNGDLLGGITSQADRGSAGNAGDVNLVIDDLAISSTGQVSSTSFGTGDAGSISVRSDEITIDGRSVDQPIVTGITSAVESGGIGEGGAILIIADRLVLRGNGAEITATNDGTGPAGTIDIQLTDSLVLDDGAGIFTESANAGGGGITIRAGNSVTATGSDSKITTTVADDSGNAGDIVIETPLMALGDTEVLAQAAAGRGGDIQISVDDLILSPDAVINAEAGATGIDGTVSVSAPEVDLTGGLAGLDSRFLDVLSLLRERCAARRATDSSSFTMGTDGSLPSDLDAPRLSLLPAGSNDGAPGRSAQRSKLILSCSAAAS